MTDTDADAEVGLDRVLECVTRFGDNPSAFYALNVENRYFTCPGVDGLIVYRRSHGYLVQFAGVFAAPEDQETLLRAFVAYAAATRHHVMAIQVQREEAPLYEACGFRLNQVGSSYSVHLPEHTLRGAHFAKLRNKISRARRSGLVVEEAANDECADELAEIDAGWLRSKGRYVKKIDFLVGERGGPVQDLRRLFVARREGRTLAYISYSPVYGARPGWLHDLTRRRPEASPGLMEAINHHAAGRFADEGAEWLHFGFTPFTGLSPDCRTPSSSRAMERVMELLGTYGDAVYPAQSQLAYKMKWAPQLVYPEYMAIHGQRWLRPVWRVLRVTNSI